MFRLLGSDNGFIHACGHRGHSIGAPENTLAALTATRAYGGSSAEIDVMLTADGEIVLMHDDFLDRTTNGSGLVSRATLAEIKALDGGSWFGAGFAGETVPTLAEAFAHAREIGLGLVVEVKEFQATDRLVDRLGALIEETGAADDAIFISFDHAFLKTLKDALPGIRTEGTVPPSPVARSRRMPRAITCGSAKTSATVLIGPAGTLAASSAARRSSREKAAIRAASIGSSPTRLPTRAALVAKRASAASSGQPRTVQRLRNWPSLPTATMTWPSATGKTW